MNCSENELFVLKKLIVDGFLEDRERWRAAEDKQMENTISLCGQNVVCCLYCRGLAISAIHRQTLVVTVNQMPKQRNNMTQESIDSEFFLWSFVLSDLPDLATLC